MKNNKIAALICALTFCLAGCSPQRVATSAPSKSFTESLDRRVPQLMEQYGVPGASLALVRGGKLVWSCAYGYADVEHGRRMTVDAVYRVESVSKSVTAWGVMRLVEQGLIDLDEPVQTYLTDWQFPESEYSVQNITVRRLLSNNAGMPLGNITDEHAPGSDMPSLRDTLSQEAQLIREPGSGFSYSNTGFHLLELLIEDVTERDFADYMRNEVLRPLGMNDSSFEWNETQELRISMGYDLRGNPVPVYVYPAKASGGLFATVEDVARFVSAGMIESHSTELDILSNGAIRSIQTPQVDHPGIYSVVSDSYGFGHFLENLPDGRQAVWHGGQGHGWMTHFHYIPDSGDGIIILTNSQRSWPFIAQILNDWASWNGAGSVKMGRITQATTALWIFISVIFVVTLWQVYHLFGGIWRGERIFAPLSVNVFLPRAAQAIMGMGVIAVLIWSSAQPYLMVSSLFPNAAGWVGISLVFCAVINCTVALFPHQG